MRVTPQWPWLMYSHRQTSVIATSPGHFDLDRSQRFLDDSIFSVGAAGLFVFLFWNSEKQDGLEPEVLRGARFIGNFLDRKLKNARHARDRPAFIDFFAYKQRQNKIVRAQMGFAHQISQRRRTPQPPRPMHQFSHNARLRARQAGASKQEPAYSKCRFRCAQALDGADVRCLHLDCDARLDYLLVDIVIHTQNLRLHRQGEFLAPTRIATSKLSSARRCPISRKAKHRESGRFFGSPAKNSAILKAAGKKGMYFGWIGS